MSKNDQFNPLTNTAWDRKRWEMILADDSGRREQEWTRGTDELRDQLLRLMGKAA